MWRKVLVTLGIVFLSILGYSIFSYSTQEKPIDWTYTFNEFSKAPFGTKIFFNEIDSFFPNKTVQRLKSIDFKNLFEENISIDTLTLDTLLAHIPTYSLDSLEYYHNDFNFISINNYFNTTSSTSKALVNHAFFGGTVQIYAYDFSFLLKERLSIEVGELNYKADGIPNLSTEKIITWNNDSFDIRKSYRNTYFVDFPDEASIILKDEAGNVRGIEFYLGYGRISFITLPHIFTNYDLLHNNKELQEILISDLPIKDTYWSPDMLKILSDQQAKKNLLYYIFSHPTLKWAYFLLIISLIAFVLLNLQRKQRSIPIVKPPKNLTLTFLQTISDLHFARVDYKSMLRKKMNFLRQQIKNDYHLNQKKVDDDYIVQLAKRSKLKIESIQRLFRFYNELMMKEQITEVEFNMMCKLFQLFKN